MGRRKAQKHPDKQNKSETTLSCIRHVGHSHTSRVCCNTGRHEFGAPSFPITATKHSISQGYKFF